MKGAWQTATIGEVCTVFSGGTPFKGNKEYWRGNIPWVSAKDLKADQVSDAALHISTQACAQSAAKIAPTGSLLVLVRGMGLANGVPIGEVISPVAFNQDIRAIVPPKTVAPRFLLLALRHSLSSSDGKAVLSSAAHGTLKIDAEALRQVSFHLPPLPEQQRMVAILDEAFEGIATAKANAEKNLQNARELFEGQVESVFSRSNGTWSEHKLSELGTTQTGSTPKAAEAEKLGDSVPFIKPGDFNRDGSLNYANEGLSDIGAQSARIVSANSVLMVCIGATIGKTGLSDREIATNQQINAFTPATGLVAKFVYYQMITADFQRRVLLNSGQATLPIINKSKWSALTLSIAPTRDEQQAIVDALDRLGSESARLGSVYRAKLAALEELKKSLLRQAFTGQL